MHMVNERRQGITKKTHDKEHAYATTQLKLATHLPPLQ